MYTHKKLIAFLGFILLSLSACRLNNMQAASEKANVETKLINEKVNFQFFLTNFFVPNITSLNTSALQQIIHPKYGVFVVYKPASYSIVKKFDNIESILESLPYLGEYMQGIYCKYPEKEELPTFNCEKFNKKGCFYNSPQSKSYLTNQILQSESILNYEFEPEEKKQAAEIDQKITEVLVITESYIEFSFIEEDDQWFLVAIDLAKYSCDRQE